jgi:hypothetical protein
LILRSYQIWVFIWVHRPTRDKRKNVGDFVRFRALNFIIGAFEKRTACNSHPVGNIVEDFLFLGSQSFLKLRGWSVSRMRPYHCVTAANVR